MDKRLSRFWVYGCYRVVTNVSKNINTLFISEQYIGIFEIDTKHTFHATFNYNCYMPHVS
jgi:hypothetical protein